ncbi:hypothetical protein ACE6H2_000967 [Prunus campanulata]
MVLEDDDWDLSAEELDSLERDAFQNLAQQCINSASALKPRNAEQQKMASEVLLFHHEDIGVQIYQMAKEYGKHNITTEIKTKMFNNTIV